MFGGLKVKGWAAGLCLMGLSGCGGASDLLGDVSGLFDAPAAAPAPQAPQTGPHPTKTVVATAKQTSDSDASDAASATSEEAKTAQKSADADRSDAEAAADAAARPEMRAAVAAAGPSTAMALSYPEPQACRTVRLYKRPKIRVSKKLPDAWRAFAGHWGDGSWDGKLCQELVIDKINKDGTVTLYDMQGYYTPWKRVPTAFRRTGEFLPDGRLRVDLGKMGVAVYELRGDTLYGVYDWGVSTARIAMVRKKKKR